MSKFTGTKYAATEDLDIAVVAKLVRADIKAAVVKGELPAAKYAVKIARYAGGESLDIRASGFAFPVLCEASFILPDGASFLERPYGAPYHSPEATKVVATLEAIRNSYNYDRSDSMTDHFDYRFGGDSKIENTGEEHAALTARRIAERRAARVEVAAPAANDTAPMRGLVAATGWDE